MGLYGATNTTSGYPFGAAENSGAYRCMITNPYSSADTAYVYGSNGNNYTTTVLYMAQGCNELEITWQSPKVNAVNKTNNYTASSRERQSAYTMTSNLYLFAQNYNGSPRFGNTRQISYFKYYDKNDTLICDLIPCYRKIDGMIGMYDIVRKQFLTNQGSGSFTKGADV